jgi:hypothetical protein
MTSMSVEMEGRDGARHSGSPQEQASSGFWQTEQSMGISGYGSLME